VEPIAAEPAITRARFYAYYTSKNDALAALIRRMIAARSPTYDHPDSWFVGRSPQVSPARGNSAIRSRGPSTLPGRTASCCAKRANLWTAVPEVRDAWLNVIEVSTTRHREGDPAGAQAGGGSLGYDARRIAEALVWQSERLCFRAWARIPERCPRSSCRSLPRGLHAHDLPRRRPGPGGVASRSSLTAPVISA